MRELAVGSSIDGLRVEALAARGGSSLVYRAIDPSNRQEKAVKVLLHASDITRRRLQREAALLARLDHAGLAPFEGLHEHGDDVVVITSWVEGQTLKDWAPGQNIDADLVLDVLRRLASPLDYLHANEIVHRDISPSNIMRGPNGAITLIDVGIGNPATEPVTDSLRSGIGPARYLAPEICWGEPATARSDQYSLAAVLFELVVGPSPVPPTAARSTSRDELDLRGLRPLAGLHPAVPPALAAALTRALQDDPKHRFPTITDFAQAATAATARVPGARRTGLGRRVTKVGAALLAAAAATLFLWPEGAEGPGSTVDEVLAVAQAGPGLDSDAPDTPPSPPLGDDLASQDLAGDDLGAGLSVSSTWTPGFAASLACNQLAGSTFEDGTVPTDYYGNPPGRERVVAQGGFGNSRALEVGVVGDYGQYSELVPVEAGATYWFRAWFAPQGEIAVAEMGIALLDAQYQQLDAGVAVPIVQTAPGFLETQLGGVPSEAAFALPYLFKDASPGTLLADELAFGVANDCFAEISVGTG